MRVLFDPSIGRRVKGKGGYTFAQYDAAQRAAMNAPAPDPEAEKRKREADAEARQGTRATLLSGLGGEDEFGTGGTKRKSLFGAV